MATKYFMTVRCEKKGASSWKGREVGEYKKGHESYEFCPLKIGQVSNRQTSKESGVWQAIIVERNFGNGY